MMMVIVGDVEYCGGGAGKNNLCDRGSERNIKRENQNKFGHQNTQLLLQKMREKSCVFAILLPHNLLEFILYFISK